VKSPPQPEAEPDDGPPDPMAGLTLRLDGYGREIFVEEMGTNGKPTVWYDYDSKGRRKRWTRKLDGIFGELAE